MSILNEDNLDYPGCSECIHYDYYYWELTCDSEDVCNHNPKPNNRNDILNYDAPCPYYETQ